MQHVLIDGFEPIGLVDDGVEVGLEPLWADDAGRSNMSGTFTGTFNGWYPALTLTFRDLSPAEFMYNLSLVTKPLMNITYDDPTTMLPITNEFYGTAVKSKVKLYRYYEGWAISFVGTTKLW